LLVWLVFFGSSGVYRQLNQKAQKQRGLFVHRHGFETHNHFPRRAGAGLREREPCSLLPEEFRKTKFYSLHKLCYTTCTSINILTSKGGEVLMATKKAAAKKPVKKAAKKK
jgi:hypothetical protein